MVRAKELPPQKRNRIFFPDNPWPNGHRIKSIQWRGELRPSTGLYFGLNLRSEDYYAEDPKGYEKDDAQSDWTSETVWSNFHACRIQSASGWNGFPAFDMANKLDLRTLEKSVFRVDVLPMEFYEDWAFNVYLLGHDTVADHTIRFYQRQSHDTFSLEWTGQIALTYAGEDEFNYRFEAQADSVRLEGLYLPAECTTEAGARRIMEAFLAEPEQFELGWSEPYETDAGQYFLTIRP